MLYTRKGDDGTTIMFGCAQRVAKNSPLCEALGAVDELNAWLGLCVVKAEDDSLKGLSQSMERAGCPVAVPSLRSKSFDGQAAPTVSAEVLTQAEGAKRVEGSDGASEGVSSAELSEDQSSVHESSKSFSYTHVIKRVQQVLFIIQAELAGAEKTVDAVHVQELEKYSDALESILPPITSFSLAGGTELSALCDVARTFARRAERRVLVASEAGEVVIGQHTKAYLNRLSSILFALARSANHQAGVPERAPEYR